MKAKVRLFARLSELAGTREVEVEVGEGLSAGEVYRALCAKYPALNRLDGSLRYAVNGEYADSERTVGEGDEVALIPPVSGGARVQPARVPMPNLLQALLIASLALGFAAASGLGWLILYQNVVDASRGASVPSEPTVRALQALGLLMLVVWFLVPVGLSYLAARRIESNAMITVLILLPGMLLLGFVAVISLSWYTGCHLGSGFPIPGVGEECG